MAVAVWRIQADVPIGEKDPDVMVFVGETYTNDQTQEKVLHRDGTNYVVMKLSTLPGFLEDPKMPVRATPQAIPTPNARPNITPIPMPGPTLPTFKSAPPTTKPAPKGTL